MSAIVNKADQVKLIDYDQIIEFKEPYQFNDQISQDGSLVDQFEGTSKNPKQISISRGKTEQDDLELTIRQRNSQYQNQQAEELLNRQLLLQFKIRELQKICSTLSSANSKLLDKIEQLQQQNQELYRKNNHLQNTNSKVKAKSQSQNDQLSFERKKNSAQPQNKMDRISHKDKDSQTYFNDDYETEIETQLEEQITEIEKLINDYRQQLQNAQYAHRNNLKLINTRIQSMEQQIATTRQQLTKRQQQLTITQLQFANVRQYLENTQQQLSNTQQQLKNAKLIIYNTEQQIQKTQQQLAKSHQQLVKTQHQLAKTQIQAEQVQIINSQLEQQLLSLSNKNHTLENSLHSLISNNNQSLIGQNYSVIGKTKYPRNGYLNNRHHTLPPEQQGELGRTQSRTSIFGGLNGNRSSFFQDLSLIYQQSSFDSSVQLELQKLIQKLVNQLEHERIIKKKINQQLKILQKQLLDNEKIIMFKNQNIFELQMQLICAQKNTFPFLNNSKSSKINNKKGDNQITISQKDQRQLKITEKLNQNETQPNSTSASLINPNSSKISPIQNQNINKQTQKYGSFFKSKTQLSNPTLNANVHKNVSSNHNITCLKRLSFKNRDQNQNYDNQFKATNAQSKIQPYKPQSYFNNRAKTQTASSSVAFQSKVFQTFSLLELLNEPQIGLSVREKLYITLKVVVFYQERIFEPQNYNILRIQNVLVTNFNRINLDLIKIRVLDEDVNNQREDTENIMDGNGVWNLGLLLRSLLVEAPAREQDQPFGQLEIEKTILEQISNILQNRSLEKETLELLKEELEIAITERNGRKCN